MRYEEENRGHNSDLEFAHKSRVVESHKAVLGRTSCKERDQALLGETSDEAQCSGPKERIENYRDIAV